VEQRGEQKEKGKGTGEKRRAGRRDGYARGGRHQVGGSHPNCGR